MAQSVNTFTKLNSDSHPINTRPDTLIDAVNVTFTTAGENQIILQNMEGNEVVATLTSGARPIAVRVYNNVAYIVSVIINPLTGTVVGGELGTFPSPDWNILNSSAPGTFTPLTDDYRPLHNFLLSTSIIPFGGQYDDFNFKDPFRTPLFNFTGDLVELELQLSYDGSVNMIITDDVNPVRLINTGFVVDETGNNAKREFRRLEKDINTYSEDAFYTTKLLKQASEIPLVRFKGCFDGGSFTGGGARFYFRYVDADGNLTEIVEESRLVQFAHNSNSTGSHGANPGEQTGRYCKFEFYAYRIDRQYTGIKVYYGFSASDVEPVAEIREINKIYTIPGPSSTGSVSSLDIYIFGDEPYTVITNEELNIEFNALNQVKTMTQYDSRLIFGNTASLSAADLDTLANVTNKVGIREYLWNRSYDGTGNIFDNDIMRYDQVGYWDAETYELAVVYILPNGATTPAMPLRGIDNLRNYLNFNSYTNDPVEKDGYVKDLTPTPPLGVPTTIDPKYTENILGVYRTSHNRWLYKGGQTEVKWLMIDPIDLRDRIDAAVSSGDLEVKPAGFFIVRKERKRDAICQGYITNTAEFPLGKCPSHPTNLWQVDSHVGGGASTKGINDKKEFYSQKNNSKVREHLVDLTQGIGTTLYNQMSTKIIPAPFRVIEAGITSALNTSMYAIALANNTHFTSAGTSPDFDSKKYWHDSLDDTTEIINKVAYKELCYSAQGHVLPEQSGKPLEESCNLAFYTGDELANEAGFTALFNGKSPKGIVISPRSKVFGNSSLFTTSPAAGSGSGGGKFEGVVNSIYIAEDIELQPDVTLNAATKVNYINEGQDAFANEGFSAKLSRNALFATRFIYAEWSKGYKQLDQEVLGSKKKLDTRIYETDSDSWQIDIWCLGKNNHPMLDPDGKMSDYGIPDDFKKDRDDYREGKRFTRAGTLGEDNLIYGSYIGLHFGSGVGTSNAQSFFLGEVLKNDPITNIPAINVAGLAVNFKFKNNMGISPYAPPNLATEIKDLGSNSSTYYNGTKNAATAVRASFVNAMRNRSTPFALIANIYENPNGMISSVEWKAKYNASNFSESYYSVTRRVSFDEFAMTTGNGNFGFGARILPIADGDCFTAIVQKMVYRSSGIEGILTASDPKAYLRNNQSAGLYDRGFWMPLVHLSNYNLALRSYDYSAEDENTAFGGPREFWKGASGDLKDFTSRKRAEPKKYNFGYNYAGSKVYTAINPTAPAFNTRYDNRIFVSEKNATSSFVNNYRNFFGLNFKDYHQNLGPITKLITKNDTVFCVFENGVGVLPINEKNMISEEGGGIFIDNAKLLAEKMYILSDEFGSEQQFSIVAGENSIFGYHLKTNKIWEVKAAGSKSKFSIISDFAVQSILNSYKDSFVGNFQPVVRGVTDAVQNKIYFSFLNKISNAYLPVKPSSSHNPRIGVNNPSPVNPITSFTDSSLSDEELNLLHPEVTASIVYNEILDSWVTKLSWSPLFMFTIKGELYTNSADQKINQIWKHGKNYTKSPVGAPYSIGEPIPYCNFYGQQHEFIFEFVVVDNSSMQKIVDNLLMITNRSYPDSIVYTIENDFDFELNSPDSNSSHVDYLKQRRERLRNEVLNPATIGTPTPLTSTANFYIAPGTNEAYFNFKVGFNEASKFENGFLTDSVTGNIITIGDPVIINETVYNKLYTVYILPGHPSNVPLITPTNLVFLSNVEYGILKQNIEYLEDHMRVVTGRNGSNVRDKAIKIKVTYKGEDYTTVQAIMTLFNYSYA